MSASPTQAGGAPPPWSLMAPDAESRPSIAANAPPGDTDFGVDEGYMFGKDGFTFLDFLDIINPLQHIPVVSSIYRNLTGDEIDPGARMVGSAIFGGPSGFAMAVVNNAMDAHTGQDIGETVMAAIDPELDDAPTDTAVLAAARPLDAVPVDPAPAGLPTAEAPVGAATALSSVPVASTSNRPFAAFSTASPALVAPAREIAPAGTPVAAIIAARSRPATSGQAVAVPVPATLQPVENRTLQRGGRTVARVEPAGPASRKPAQPANARAQLAAATVGSTPAPARSASMNTAPLDAALIPQAMLSALEKYEKLKGSH